MLGGIVTLQKLKMISPAVTNVKDKTSQPMPQSHFSCALSYWLSSESAHAGLLFNQGHLDHKHALYFSGLDYKPHFSGILELTK